MGRRTSSRNFSKARHSVTRSTASRCARRSITRFRLGYMAPEQVRGVTTDYRADIFAFGVILYEMLCGHRAFLGETAMDTMMAIAKEAPADLQVEKRHIPPALARIVDRCLEKNPAARFQSTRDLAFALESLSAHSDAAMSTVVSGHQTEHASRLLACSVASGKSTCARSTASRLFPCVAQRTPASASFRLMVARSGSLTPEASCEGSRSPTGWWRPLFPTPLLTVPPGGQTIASCSFAREPCGTCLRRVARPSS
jgi:serine/threonine protein kinase